MKINLPQPPSWLGPYQLAEKLMFWVKKDPDPFSNKCDIVFEFGDYLSKLDWLIAGLKKFDDLKTYIHERSTKIRIDSHDVWNADYTLASIIVPVLQEYKKETMGSFHVDDEDAPDISKEVEDYMKAKHDYVINEMIWTFSQVISEEDLEHVTDCGNSDVEKYTEYQNRMSNGFRLFGKYYQGLWT
jgi:hypothetical protein